MKRLAYSTLQNWRTSKTRSPLIVKGARQVGKTYLIEEFGKNEFPEVHVFNFEADLKLKLIFEADLDVNRIIQELSFVADKPIKEDDLIFFDEIQECPRALTSLKYFAENKSKQAVICAGSLLGVLLNNVSYPVGKVEYLWLGPLTFKEYLLAIGEERSLISLDQLVNTLKISEIEHLYLMEQFRRYSVIGGLPGVLNRILDRELFDSSVMSDIRTQQENILRTYMGDFSKYSESANALHIRAIFENIPNQLSKVNDGTTKKFKFSEPIQGRKGYAQLNNPIEWLDKSGLVYKIMIANRSELPLQNFCRENIFKLFIFDIGILGALLRLPPESIYKDNYGLTRGYFAESICLQAIVQADMNLPVSWMEGNSEIEFLLLREGEIVPVEVKAGTRTQAKSLSTYIRKYSPKLAIKFYSGQPFYDSKLRLYNLPIYLSHVFRELKI